MKPLPATRQFLTVFHLIAEGFGNHGRGARVALQQNKQRGRPVRVPLGREIKVGRRYRAGCCGESSGRRQRATSDKEIIHPATIRAYLNSNLSPSGCAITSG